MLSVFFLDTVTPKPYAIAPKDPLLAMLMHKQFEIPVLTTGEAVSKTTPSKQETSYGIRYRNLCIFGLDSKYNREHTFAEEADERLHYEFLNSVLSNHPEPIVRELKRTQTDVLLRLQDAKVQKRSKELLLVMAPPPPLYTSPLTC